MLQEQQVFIIKWLLSQSDLFLNRVKGRVSFLWRCKSSPFEPYWLSTWVVHWIHIDRCKTCTHTAHFHSTSRHFIYSLAQLMSLSKVPLKCQSKLAFFPFEWNNKSLCSHLCRSNASLVLSSGSCLIATSVLLLKWVFHLFIQMWKFLQAHFDVWNGA